MASIRILEISSVETSMEDLSDNVSVSIQGGAFSCVGQFIEDYVQAFESGKLFLEFPKILNDYFACLVDRGSV